MREKIMNIGFDISQTGASKTGCGYWANSLITEIMRQDIKNHYLLYRTFGNFYWDLNFEKIVIPQQQNVREAFFHTTLEEARAFWQQPVTSIETALGSPAIVHVNNYFCPDERFSKAKLIYTLYDLSFVDYPEWSTEENRYFCFDNVFNASLYADHIIAISEYSKKHFLDTFPHFSEEKISVIYPASRYQYNAELSKPDRFSDFPSLTSGGFWLKTGTIEPRKNHAFLLQAYAELKASQKKVLPLVLAGGDGWMMQDFQAQIVALNLQDDVILLGYVSDEELQWLYQACYAFLYPSLFEGFGMPVLEAMACGALVITSDVSSIPEITSDAAILIDPHNVETLVDAMRACSEGRVDRAALQQKAKKRAECFSWEKSAQQVLSVYAQYNNGEI